VIFDRAGPPGASKRIDCASPHTVSDRVVAAPVRTTQMARKNVEALSKLRLPRFDVSQQWRSDGRAGYGY